MPVVDFKFGAHQFLWKSHWTDCDLGILDQARSLGLTLFEISLGDDVGFDRARVRRHAESLSIELIVGPGNHWPEDCNLSADDAQQRRLGLAWHKKTVEQAAELGAAAYCGAHYGHPGHVCRRPPPAEELPRAAENLHALGEANGCVRLMLETFNTGPEGFGFSRGIFQNLCPDPRTFVRQGTAFLRGSIAAAWHHASSSVAQL
jgi:sugar phosphate isomerase/epimerase